MRTLSIRHAAALFDVQFLGGSGAEHPIRIRPDVEGAKLAQLAGADDITHGSNMWTVALRVAAQKLNSVLLRSFDHVLGLGERDRHGFLHDDVLAMLKRHDRVRRVEPIRGGDPYRFDMGIRAELLNAIVGLCAIAVLKGA